MKMEDEEGWRTDFCLDVDGFPTVLYAATSYLGILEYPEYVGREYEEFGTERCEVTIHIGRSVDHPDKKPWNVSTTGFSVLKNGIGALTSFFSLNLSTNPSNLARNRAQRGWESESEVLVLLKSNEVSQQQLQRVEGMYL